MITSIFNDAVGPVMRGASSSHCAAALRIGRIARDLMDGDIAEILVEYDIHGSLPTTHTSQCSDMGLYGGLMGWEAADERLPDSPRILAESGVKITVEYIDIHDPHPNTYRLTLKNESETHTLIAISTGGGMIEVQQIDDFPVEMGGGYHITLIYAKEPWIVAEAVNALGDIDDVKVHDGGLLEVRAAAFISDEQMVGVQGVENVRRLSPVLPVASRKGIKIPFSTCEEMLAYDAGANRPLWELAVDYEAERGNLSREEVLAKMVEIVHIARRSIEQGIAGTEYEDRILGHQSGGFKELLEAGGLLDAGMLNLMVVYVTALMEVKSSMGVIIAAPTAGACAGFPGATLAAVDAMGLGDEEAAKAMLAGGLVGVFIATRSTFAAEVSGCQAEGGSASGMAAAALAHLGGATLQQSIAATSMALQSCLGMICDPVANRVEVPCLGRNVIAASNAISCANMALANYDPVITLDEVIATMDDVGRNMPREYRCTGLGGLAITDSSKKIEARLCGNCTC